MPGGPQTRFLLVRDKVMVVLEVLLGAVLGLGSPSLGHSQTQEFPQLAGRVPVLSCHVLPVVKSEVHFLGKF